MTTGLVLHLDAQDSGSYPGTGTTWTDLVTGTQTFTFSSAPAHNASVGFFNFSGNHAAGTTSINPTRGAVEVWFRWRVTSGITVGVLFTGAVNWLSLGNVTGSLADESLEFFTGVSACMDDRQGHNYYKDGAWHQMVAVIDGADNKLYVDGVAVATHFRTGNATSTGLMSLANTVIGKYSSGYQYDGDISIIRVYDTGSGSFSASDVAQNYAANAGRFGGSFHPGQLSTLNLWFDASDSSTLTLSGVDVDEVRDKACFIPSGKLVPYASKKPTKVTADGREWLSFDGANLDHMQAESGGSGLSFSTLRNGNSWEMYVVARVVSAPNATQPPSGAQIIGGSGGWWGIQTRTGLSAGKVRVAPWVYNNGDGEVSVDVSTSHVYGSGMLSGSGNQVYYYDGVATTLSG
ncbi:LamG domain-containing protein, partial [bacterium]|nr:LamG domain-containing protein [bacterium]